MTKEEITKKLISAKNTVIVLEEELKVYDKYGEFKEAKDLIETSYYIRVSHVAFNRITEPSLMFVHLRSEPYYLMEDIAVRFPTLRIHNIAKSTSDGICILSYTVR